MKTICNDDTYKCLNYRKTRADINLLTFPEGKILEKTPPENILAIVLSGVVELSFDRNLRVAVNPGRIIFLPKHSHCYASITQEAEILFVHLHGKIEFCDRFSLEWLSQEHSEGNEFYTLEATQDISHFIHGMIKYLADGIRCTRFLELKKNELLFLLGTYYKREELSRFFSPIASADMAFSDFIFENHTKYKTVQELAAASCHSLSAFNKIFRKSFGTSPYHWMQQQRSKQIFHDINTSDKSLKELCNEYGFHSLSQFSNFCKSQFGTSPRKLKELSSKKAEKTGLMQE